MTDDLDRFEVIRVEVDHAKKSVKLILPPLTDLGNERLSRMVYEIGRVRERWEPAGYAVSYGGRAF